jgi:peptidoglycan hydrolase-like protein with peptidoglycan-binding domain
VGRPHDLTATRFARNRILEDVFDGRRVLRDGSKGTAVRLVQESLLAQGYLLPAFGADGDFGNETETAVRAFQVDVGADVDGEIGSETMQLLDMHDPGTTAVIGRERVAGPPRRGEVPPPAATAATFAEWPSEQFAGYDASTAPDWLVVPTGGRRRAQVTLTPANAVPAYTSVAPGVATVAPTPEGVVVTGVADGNTEIRVQEGATVLDRLRIEVKDRRDRTVDYHFMSDTVPAPGPNHSTTRAPGDEVDMTSGLNQMWERQANVRFRTGVVDSPQVATNLGGQVLWTATPANEWPTIVAFGTGGDYNVFLVWEYEQDATPLVDNTNAGTTAPNTLLEDNECADGLTLAHEAGHFLGATHAMGGVMNGCPGANRQRVTKQMADAVNP